MLDAIRNNPILKTIVIIILGVLGFGLAFNIMFGSPNNGEMGYKGMGGMEGMNGGGGVYSLDYTLAYILQLGVRLFLIALVVVAIIALIKFSKKYLFEGSEFKMNDTIKNDPILKTVALILLFIFGLGAIYVLYQIVVPNQSGFGISTSNGYGAMVYHNTPNTLDISSMLALLLKILLGISIVSLVVSAVVYIVQSVSKEGVKEGISKMIPNSFSLQGKKEIGCVKCGKKVDAAATFCSTCGTRVKEQCDSCGLELKSEWKCCPVCGKEKGIIINETIKTEEVVTEKTKD